jgi:hypothetical protein
VQERARRDAAEAYARTRGGGWLASFGHHLSQQMGSAAMGYKRNATTAAEAPSGERTPVGRRKRSHKGNGMVQGREGSVPLERSLVLMSSIDDQP